nr:MAG TPA: Protein of unknown function (DUF2829) [Caudoviricetes sp.]
MNHVFGSLNREEASTLSDFFRALIGVEKIKGDVIPIKTTIIAITPVEFLCKALNARPGTYPGELVVTRDFRINCVAESANNGWHTIHISVVGKDEPISNNQNNEVITMKFLEALEHAKQGAKISREGWNGKGMFVFLVNGDSIKVAIHEAYGDPTKDGYDVRDFLMMFTAQHDLVPWVASQSDLLAEDWCVL